MKETQKDRIINYIRIFGSISTKEAFNNLGIARLGARIFELKREGYKFKETWEKSKNRYGEETKYKVFRLDDMIAENENNYSSLY